MEKGEALQLLYIEPDREVGRQVQAALPVSGFNVSLVRSGAAALAELKEGRYDVIALAYPIPSDLDLEILNALILKPDGPAVVHLLDSSTPVPPAHAPGLTTRDFLIKDMDGHYLGRLDIALKLALDKQRIKQEGERIKSELERSIVNLERERAKQEVLLREMNHRIGNSLQLVISMIRIQSMSTSNTEARQLLQQAIERVIAVADAHQNLHAYSEAQFVQMQPYLGQLLADHQIVAEMGNAQFVINVLNCQLEADRAIALGVITTELAMEALRRTFPLGKGEIRVTLGESGDSFYQLIVEDNGSGASYPLREGEVSSRLVSGMAKRLKSEILREPLSDGNKATIRFPKSIDMSGKDIK